MLAAIPLRCPLGPQPQHREQVRQIDKSFRLAAFVGRKRFALILLIQQRIQPMLNAFRQVELARSSGTSN